MVDPAVISFDKCRWHVFAYNPSGTNRVLCAAGLVSLAFTSLMMLTLVRAPSKGCSHVMIQNLSAVCWFRSLLSVFVHGVMPAFHNGFTMESCAVIGYLHKLISAYQVEAITLLSIERYVLAKYYKLGVQVKRRHYILFILLCWLFAVFYSLTPLMGFGTYLGTWEGVATPDDMGSKWSFWGDCETMSYKAINVALQLMQSVKPFVLIWYMLYWTCKIENECYTEDLKHHTEKVMTKSTLRVSLVSALCWMPTFFCYMLTIFEPKLKCSSEGLPAKLMMYGSLGFEVAPTATILALIATNEYIRSNMFKLIFFNNHVCKKTD